VKTKVYCEDNDYIESTKKNYFMSDSEYKYYWMGFNRGICEGRKLGAELAAEMYALRNVAIQINLNYIKDFEPNPTADKMGKHER
jgi:hypothetical protein